MSGVLVLNAGYEPLHRVSVRHAVRMLAREVAVVEEAHEGRSIGPYPLPRVLRLVRYVAMRWRAKTPRWSKRLVLARDGHTCAYCAGPAATVDHVKPLSKKGKSEWGNTVAACKPCNAKKGSRSPTAAGMPMLFEPFVPQWWHLSPTR